MAEMIEVEFTVESGMRGVLDTIVTVEEAELYRSRGWLVIPADDGQALTLDNVMGEEFRDRNKSENLSYDL